jgi:hypothetical protein
MNQTPSINCIVSYYCSTFSGLVVVIELFLEMLNFLEIICFEMSKFKEITNHEKIQKNSLIMLEF